MRYLAIDPGNVSGVAFYDSYSSGPPSSDEIPGGLDGLTRYLWQDSTILPSWNLDIVVIEDFIIRPDTHRKTREPAAYEGVGVAKGWSLLMGINPLLYGSSEHKVMSGVNGPKKTNKIRKLGWHKDTADLHADDACSLILRAMMSVEPATASQLLYEIGGRVEF